MEKKEFYENRAKRYTTTDKQGIIRYQRAIQLAEIKNGASILDVGCKNAHLLDVLAIANIHCDYTGIDISDAVIDSLKSKVGKFQQHDLMKPLPFESKTFDFLFCLEVLEHIENPNLVLKEFHRVLKEKGILLLSVPNVYNWIAVIANIFKLPCREGHIHCFPYREMRTLLDFTGFKIVKRVGTYGLMPYTPHGIKNNRYLMYKTNLSLLTTSNIYKISKK